MNKQTIVRLVSAVALVILANLLMTNVVLAGINTRTYSDPDLGTTNPKYIYSRASSPILASDGNAGSPLHTKLYNSIRVKVKRFAKTMAFVGQAESTSRNQIEFTSFTR
jgi:hypothetical protein